MTMRLPDFIIGGAMKSGTTTLHYVLSQHPAVFIPRPEIFFFTIDDVEQHPNFLLRERDGWTVFDYERDFDRYLAWYRDFFRPALPSQAVGEDSTTYLASAKAPARIARLLPDVKLIFMLRDPVRRAYSHYWHLVRVGDATLSFEETITRAPGTVLQRGFYKEQVERYLALFPRHHLLFVVFEEFVRDPQGSVDAACRFLGLEGTVDVGALDVRRNPGLVPRVPRLQLLYNRLLLRKHARRFAGHLPGAAERSGGPPRALRIAVEKLGFADRPPPEMASSTRRLLEQIYARENRGLESLIGRDLARYWPYLDGR